MADLVTGASLSRDVAEFVVKRDPDNAKKETMVEHVPHAVTGTHTSSLLGALTDPRDGPPLWLIALLGVFVSSIVVCIYLLTTRCPCEESVAHAEHRTKDSGGSGTLGASGASHVVGDLHDSSFILEWAGSGPPQEALKIHFLSTTQSTTTFTCDAQRVFGTHTRVRVTLPKGEYMCRVVFADGSQHICQEPRAHGVATITPNSLACRALVHGDMNPARPLPSGACLRTK